ncbi:MAG: lipoprotein [Sulfuritalea sp.]|nr:lipoprotein [Sulfuritalea sp.]
MRLIPSFFVALVTLATLAACGTKTPLSLPPQAQPAAQSAVPPGPAVDNSNKAATEPRR